MTEQEAIDYFKKATVDTKIGVDNIIKTYSIMNISIEALEKQIPKKPYDENKDKAGWHSIYRCPCCNEWVEEEGYGDILIRFNWCNNCGQKLDWSEWK